MIPEMSRIIRPDQISSQGIKMEVVATESEMAALAKRFDLRELKNFKADLRLRALAGGTVFKIDGNLSADVVQTCVVTLDPVAAHIEEDFTISFTSEPEDADGLGDELEVFFDEEDPPEPLENGVIDAGEVVSEHLALALDPFPRKEGVEFESSVDEDDGSDDLKRPNPFAALSAMRKNKG